jgi:hypothetical protein
LTKPAAAQTTQLQIKKLAITIRKYMLAAARLRCTTSSLVIIFICAAFACAADWSAPEQGLARKIAAATGPGAVAIEVTNRSSLTQGDVAEIERQLKTRLSELGVAFVPDDRAAATVQVWLSEDARSLLWIAQIHQGTNQPVTAMVSASRTQPSAGGQHAPAIAIRKTLLWNQPQRILDAALLEGNPAHLLLLDQNGVAVFRAQNSQWTPEQVLVISRDQPWPRDLRGRIIPRKDHLFDAYLPGTVCQSSASAPLTMNCRDSDDPWPLSAGQSAFFSATRNFFTGVLTPGIGKQTTTAPFYSAAALPRPNYTLWLLTGVDGRVHMLDGLNDQIANLNWGSDAAPLRSNCGSGTQLLVSASGSGSQDALQAFEVADRAAMPVSATLDLGGEITALWTDANGTSVVAVSRNAQTRAYEAYRLSITCGQ